jgi:phosphotriesterase-related protein
MLDAGFEDNLLIGLDTTRARLRAYGGTPGLSYILDKFIPFLNARGVTPEQVQKFFVYNPARAFA